MNLKLNSKRTLFNILAALVFGLLLTMPTAAQTVDGTTLDPTTWEVIQLLIGAAVFCFVAWLLARSIPPEQKDRLFVRAETELQEAEVKAKLTPSFIDDLAVELGKRGLVIARQSTSEPKTE